MPIFEAAVKAGTMLEMMDRGVDATIYALADLADDYIAIQVPAYGAVRDACGSIVTCRTALVSTRNDLFMDIAHATGIYQLIAAIVRVWKAIPAAVREAARDAIAVATNAVNAVTDAFDALASMDVTAMWAQAKAGLGLFVTSGKLVFNLAAQGAELLSDLYNKYLGPILGAIESIPVLGDIVSGAVDLGETIVSGLSDLGDAIAESPLGEAASAVGDWLGL